MQTSLIRVRDVHASPERINAAFHTGVVNMIQWFLPLCMQNPPFVP